MTLLASTITAFAYAALFLAAMLALSFVETRWWSRRGSPPAPCHHTASTVPFGADLIFLGSALVFAALPVGFSSPPLPGGLVVVVAALMVAQLGRYNIVRELDSRDNTQDSAGENARNDPRPFCDVRLHALCDCALLVAAVPLVMSVGSDELVALEASQHGILQWHIWRHPVAALLAAVATTLKVYDHGSAVDDGRGRRRSPLDWSDYAQLVGLSALFATLFLGAGRASDAMQPEGTTRAMAGAAIGGVIVIVQTLVVALGFCWLRWRLRGFSGRDLRRYATWGLVPLALAACTLSAVVYWSGMADLAARGG